MRGLFVPSHRLMTESLSIEEVPLILDPALAGSIEQVARAGRLLNS